MSKLLGSVAILLSLLSCVALHAQEDDGPPVGDKPDTFRIDLAGTVGRVSHSLYDHLLVIDERADSSALGWLGNGTYYGVRVCLAGPLDQQLAQLLGQLTDSTAGAGPLLIEMRHFVVYDDGKKRNASLRFRFFGGKGGLYSMIKDVDTTVSVRAAMGRGGREKFATAVNGALSVAIAGVLRRTGDSTTGFFTRGTIPSADQIWKRQLPLYQTDVYPDGFYLTFASFAKLRPEYTRSPSLEVNPAQVYAIVIDGKAYISFEGESKPLIKKDGDFFIIGKVRVDAPGADAAAGLAGFAIAAASFGKLPFMQVWGLTVKKKFLFMMDYQTGRFVPVKPVD